MTYALLRTEFLKRKKKADGREKDKSEKEQGKKRNDVEMAAQT